MTPTQLGKVKTALPPFGALKLSFSFSNSAFQLLLKQHHRPSGPARHREERSEACARHIADGYDDLQLTLFNLEHKTNCSLPRPLHDSYTSW